MFSKKKKKKENGPLIRYDTVGELEAVKEQRNEFDDRGGLKQTELSRLHSFWWKKQKLIVASISGTLKYCHMIPQTEEDTHNEKRESVTPNVELF